MKRFLVRWFGSEAARKTEHRKTLGLESLEDRRLLATLGIDANGVLTYTAGDGIANTLSVGAVRLLDSNLLFTESAETISAPGFMGDGTGSVIVPGDAISAIVIDLGDGSDSFAIEKAHVPVQVNAGAGSDLVQVGSLNLGLTLIGAPVTVDGQEHDAGGGDTIRIADEVTTLFLPSSPKFYTVKNDSITRRFGDPATEKVIDFEGIEQLVLDANHAATFNILSTAAGTPATINAGPGDDTFNVGVFSPEGPLTFELIESPVTIDGGAGIDVLNVNDQDEQFGRAYALSASSIVRDDSAPVDYGAVEEVRVFAGGGSDRVAVKSMAPGLSVLVDARSGNDRFLLGDSGSLTGMSGTLTLIGNSGVDTLDYSAVSTQLAVNLAAGTATGVTGGISGLENVFGGSGKNKLTGNALANILVGGASNDMIAGAGGRDLLIGGLGKDILNGGAGEDILVGGSTIYGNDLTALQPIQNEWTRTDRTYLQRVASLRNGGGLNQNFRLNARTVIHDTAADSLLGSDGLDWFWALAPDVTDRVTIGIPEQLN